MDSIDIAGLNGVLISSTRRALKEGVGGVKQAKERLKLLIEPSVRDDEHRYPWQYFRLLDTSGVVIEDATQDPPKTFREFVEAPPLRGLGESMADIERLLADDAEALVRLRRLTVAPRHLHQDRGDDNNNVIIIPDMFTPPEPEPKAKSTQGNSRAYTLDRLERERPDLFELVVQEEMSANAAAIAAGWRKAPSALETAQRAWTRMTEDEQREFLHWISNDQ